MPRDMRRLSVKEHMLNWLCFLFVVPIWTYGLYIAVLMGLLVLGLA
jgi:hypothetical protein